MYDFDKTLCTKDMQDYAFIPSLNMTPSEFWDKTNEVGTKLQMGTAISNEFKKIFGCEFVYDEKGLAVFPKTAVNYTNKTQFVYRINKGVLDISNDEDLNKSMPDDSKRIPFCNMIYIGDGLSDVPCMKMMKSYGGVSIAVYQGEVTKKVMDLLLRDRVDFIYPADYREHSGLDKTVKNIIRKMAVCEKLYIENFNQKNGKFQ